MKKSLRTGIYVILCIGIIVSINQSAMAKTILKMNHQMPADASGSKIDQWFADELKAATNGEIEIRIFWSNTLGSAKENLILLKNGIIDMAAMSPGYFPDELPFFCAPNSIPMGMDDICQSSQIMKAFMDNIPEFKQEASRNNIRPLFFHLLNPYLLITKKPVKLFSDLKGLKIRTWGEDMPRLVKAAGGLPVSLFLPDLYQALDRNVIDGCPFSVDMMVTYKIHELAKHVTEVVMWEGPSWGTWISEKAWSKLSSAHQEILTTLAEKVWGMDLAATAESEKDARKFLKANGVTFHSFPAEELAAWQKANPDFFNDWIQKMENQGKGNAAKQTIALWKQMRETVHCPAQSEE